MKPVVIVRHNDTKHDNQTLFRIRASTYKSNQRLDIILFLLFF